MIRKNSLLVFNVLRSLSTLVLISSHLTMAVTETRSAHNVSATFHYMDLTDPNFADPVSFPSDEAER